MIKRLVFSFSLLLIGFTFAIISYFFVENKTDEIKTSFEQVQELILQEQYQEAEQKAVSSEKLWDSSMIWYNIFMDYSLFEDLEIDIPSIKKLLETQNYNYASAKVIEIIETLDSIVHEQKINIGNIL